MDENHLQVLRDDILGGTEEIRAIKQRNDELGAQEVELITRRGAAQSAGKTVPNLWHDETYQSIQAERQKIRSFMSEHLSRPRLNREQQAELRQQLQPEEKRQLREELLRHLQSLPAERKVELTASAERVMKRIAAKHGETPEVKASIAGMLKIQALINQADETS